MMRTIHLYGHLKREFGSSFQFNVDTAGEALRALNSNFPGKFVAALKEGSYQLVRGRRHGGLKLDLETVNTLRLGSADLHLIPVVAGAASGGRGKGVAKAILGVALIGAAIFFAPAGAGLLGGMGTTAFSVLGANVTWGNIALLGLGLALSGVGSLLTPQQKPKSETDDDKSFSFGGPVNVNEQGNAIPLIYGEVIIGSQPISAGFDIEDLNALKTANANSGVPAVDAAPLVEDPTP